MSPESPREQGQKAWESYREERRAMFEKELPCSAQEALNNIQDIDENWFASAHIYASNGSYVADKEMRVYELKDLLKDLLGSKLQFHITLGSRESRREEREKAQGNASVPVEILEELMDMAQRGGGELMNMRNPNLKALKGLFRDIQFELEKYLPEEPSTKEHPAGKTKS